MVFFKIRFLCKIHKAPSLSLEWFILLLWVLIVVCELQQKEWNRFNQSNFPIFQCHSAIHWVGCMFKEKIPLSNVSSACMLSFTFHIVVGKKYTSWQISDAPGLGLHFKNRISQLSVQAKPSLGFNFKNTSCYTHKPNAVLFFLLIFIMSDPRLQILIAQAAPYVHAISVFFCSVWSLIGLIHSSKVNHLRPGKWLGLIPVVRETLIMTVMRKIDDSTPCLIK